MMQHDPGQEVDQGDAAGEQSHDDGHVQTSHGEDQQVVGQDPHQAEEGAPAQKLDRSDALTHQMIQAFPGTSKEKTEKGMRSY